MTRVYNNCEDARSLVFSRVLEGSRSELYYLSLCEINNGPGDTCLVSVDDRYSPGRETLSGDRIVFVRGNVAVYLLSYYKDFGCMDLACRLDALIVEQMEKQKKQHNTKFGWSFFETSADVVSDIAIFDIAIVN